MPHTPSHDVVRTANKFLSHQYVNVFAVELHCRHQNTFTATSHVNPVCQFLNEPAAGVEQNTQKAAKTHIKNRETERP